VGEEWAVRGGPEGGRGGEMAVGGAAIETGGDLGCNLRARM
jgi:hypothetical protein